MSPELPRLYDLAEEFYRLAPWGWMDEGSLIALRHPSSGEVAYLSVTGTLGDHLSLTLYVGEEALHRFNLIHAAEILDIPLSEADIVGLIVEARQLQVSFGKRPRLEKADLAQIKSLERTFFASIRAPG